MELPKSLKQCVKRILCLLLTAVLLVSCSVADGVPDAGKKAKKEPDKAETYTFLDAVSTLSANWNPHTYMTADDSYPLSYTTDSLYTMVFNDKLHPVEGKEPYESYVIVPEMAADDPIDITAEVRVSHPQFELPKSADRGYAYRIPLRHDLCWDDGTPITAETFVQSLKRLLDPKLLNYRATEVCEGAYSIANAANYASAGMGSFKSFAELGTTYEEYIAEGHSDDEVYVDISGLWNIVTEDKKPYASITDDTQIRDEAVAEGEPEDYVSGKYIWDTYLSTGQIGGAEQFTGILEYKYGADYSFDNVGLYAEDDYNLVFVFNNALEGFYLNYGLSTGWLIKPDLYDACLKETKTASGSVWSSNYATNKKTSVSYGPYKISSYQMDKSIRFERNENWYGYSDGNHVYVDPEDGKQYDMYQTTDIKCQVIAESSTRKQMFFSGKLMSYGLSAEDFDQYRNSEFCYQTPLGTIFFIILNGYDKVIKKREEASDFDKKTRDIETITLPEFRRAFAVAFDKSKFTSSIMPRCTEGYGLIGSTYIYDPDTLDYYRNTDLAKRTICEFYSVDPSDYSSLDSAEESITGYDEPKAKELFEESYKKAIDKGYLTDKNGDGISDQEIVISYVVSTDSDHITKIIDYLNEGLSSATEGTGLEGRVRVEKSAPLGNDWATQLRNGLCDVVIGGWSGSLMDPFSLTQVYADPDRAYNGNWYDPASHQMTVRLGKEDVALSVAEWSKALNGESVSKDGTEYNFGYGKADTKERLKILAAFEKEILSTYDYIPLANDGSMQLLSQQVYYVTEKYNPVLDRGDISYIRYNYSDSEWKSYLKKQGGVLRY